MSETGENVGARGRTESSAGTGVHGMAAAESGTTYGVRGIAVSTRGTGVFGRVNANSGTTYGVRGEAESKDGFGVYGISDNGQGVHGETESGVGVVGRASTGIAIRANGRVQIQRASGVATITAGTNSVTVKPDITLTTNSAVLATLNGDPLYDATIYRVRVNVDRNELTVFLTGNTAQNVRVAWLVLG